MMENQIPKKIHYCWFGRNPLPKSALKCIQSWEKFFPGYEIIQWNEDNYDVNKINYTKQAYQAKKYAFVSDYARFDIIYHEGGLYFDTDVEVIKPFDDILENGAFMGCEIDGSDMIQDGQTGSNGGKEESQTEITVAAGLGIAAARGLEVYKEILDFYETQNFLDEDGALNQETVVTKITKILRDRGLRNTREIQKVCQVTVYPKEYFNPLNNNTGVVDMTENTHSIHWYSMSWISPVSRFKSRITRVFHRFFGEDCFEAIKKRL